MFPEIYFRFFPRGFLLAPLVAESAGAPMVAVRKAGKLPGETASVSYSLEYGEAAVEVQRGPLRKILAGKEEGEEVRVAVVDALLATGGTMEAAVKLLKVRPTSQFPFTFF